jgi:hypothetical protein
LLTIIIGLRFGVQQVHGSFRKIKWFGRERTQVMLRSYFYDGHSKTPSHVELGEV